MIKTILEKFNIKNPDKISQCINQEDGSTYNVWEIDYEGKKYILKQTKGLKKKLQYHMKKLAPEQVYQNILVVLFLKIKNIY